MPPARSGLAVAAALALACAGLACTKASSHTGMGGARCESIASAASGSMGGSGGAPIGTVGTGGTEAACTKCLDTITCEGLMPTCGPECLALQACLDTVCFNLSVLAAPTEGDCQVYCENLYPAGKIQLVLLAACVQMGSCQPPCTSYPGDYDQCVIEQNAGACKAAHEACLDSDECLTYQCCASNCTTFTDCQACAGDTDGGVGAELYGAWQLCLDTACVRQGWLPAM